NAVIGTTVGITAQAVDSDGTDSVTYSLSDDAGGLFSIDGNTGVVTVAGALDAETVTSHRITIVATSSDTSDSSQSYTITITDVDEFDVGSISNTDASGSTVAEDAVVGSTVGITALATDADVTDNVRYSLSDNAGGLFAIDSSTGVVTVASALDAEMAEKHNITVQAISKDNSTSSQTFTIHISDINDNSPSILPHQTLNINENATNLTTVGRIQAVDADTTSVLQDWRITGGNGQDIFSIDPNSGIISVMDETHLDAETQVNFTLEIEVSDGLHRATSQLVTIQLINIDEQPTATNDSVTAQEDTAMTITSVLANDLTGDGQSILVDFQDISDRGGMVTHLGKGVFRYQPPRDFNGTDTFQYTIEDANGDQSQATVTITVHAVNDIPVATGELFFTQEDKPLFFTENNLLDNDQDNESTDLNVLIENEPRHGVLNIGDQGQFSYKPDANFNGTDRFTYRVTDGDASSSTAEVVIKISATNDAAIAETSFVQLDEDQLYTFQVSDFNFTDVEGDTLEGIQLVSLPALGKLSLNGQTVHQGQTILADQLIQGKLTFEAIENESGQNYSSLSFTVFDGTEMGVISATLDIHVNPVEDSPVIIAPEILEIASTGQPVDFSRFSGQQVTISDPDTLNEIQHIEIIVSEGTLSIPDNSELTAVAGNHSSRITLSGNTETLNKVLAELVFTPKKGVFGNVELSIIANSQNTSGADISTIAHIILKIQPSVFPDQSLELHVNNTDNHNNDEQQPGDKVAVSPETEMRGKPSVDSYRAAGTDTVIATPPEIFSGVTLHAGGEKIRAEIPPDFWISQPQDTKNHQSTELRNLRGQVQKQWFPEIATATNNIELKPMPLFLPINGSGILSDDPGENEFAFRSIEYGTMGLTIGAILWMIRSGSLFSALLLSYPAWRNVDPLPVFSQSSSDE
ncbi:MAG TPA: tandem-95 repeat protein, partial [Gammaproteobacteria bacterium]|nr:tandem-95 repeat protein [Gammaproteobacteria bacterium]